jgi:coenzyme F420 hydrogenase subunit beta
MNSIPKVIDLVVKNDLCIGCGLCTYKCPSEAIKMGWDQYGFLVPELSGSCDQGIACISVCPFNPFPKDEVRTENELANIYLKDTVSYQPQLGRYNGVYAGYAKEFRLTSSSGGLATFIFTELLERGIVNHVVSVKESTTPGTHYEYSISNSKQELLAASQTKYYPVTLSTVFAKINELKGKVAIVGVACFIKAIRLTQHSDPSLKEKIPFLVGIICGGIKSRFFTEYLAGKAGVQKNRFTKPEFRIKDLNSSAGDYSFGCISLDENQRKTLKMQTVGDMWGTGLFKANACDFCDDVTTELADISLGDAWLNPFVKDGKGTNVIITRSILADKIIQEGIISKKIFIEELSIAGLLSSQQGSFNHRQTGLSYRIKHAIGNKRIIPPKRFEKGETTLDFRMVQYFRMKTRLKSIEIWKSNPNEEIFDEKIKKYLYILKKLTRIYRLNKSLGSKIRRKIT